MSLSGMAAICKTELLHEPCGFSLLCSLGWQVFGCKVVVQVVEPNELRPASVRCLQLCGVRAIGRRRLGTAGLWPDASPAFLACGAFEGGRLVRPGLGPLLACLFQADLGVSPQRHAMLLAWPVVAEMLVFAPAGRDAQTQRLSLSV